MGRCSSTRWLRPPAAIWRSCSRKLVPRPLRKLTEEPEFPADQQWMQLLVQALQSGTARPVDDPPRGLCVLAEGFSLHAGVSIRELDGDALERLARYCARPPLALGRLSVSPDGQVHYRRKHAAPGAPRLLRLSPTEFLGRIAALVPPPRAHLVRFHGVFAPHSKHRARIVPGTPCSPEPVESPPQQAPSLGTPKGEPQAATPASPIPPRQVRPAHAGHRPDWATLLRRTFAIDVLHCERCGGRRQLCGLITQQEVAHKILEHLGLPTKGPAGSPARAPPEPLEPEGFSDQDGIDPIPPTWCA